MTPPNIVTLFRIATAPVLIWILMHTGPTASWIAAGVFFVATVSDFFDGYLARAWAQQPAFAQATARQGGWKRPERLKAER